MQGTDYIFPLYLYEENMGKVEKRVNLDKDIVAKIAAAVAGETASVQQQEEEVRALEIFDYIYGVLHSPAYRAKFKEFLKSDFPRIPYPKDAAEFALYRDTGRELRMAHLMLDPPPTLSEPTARFPVPGSNVVENVASVKVLPISNSNSQLETGNNGNIGNTSICACTSIPRSISTTCRSPRGSRRSAASILRRSGSRTARAARSRKTTCATTSASSSPLSRRAR